MRHLSDDDLEDIAQIIANTEARIMSTLADALAADQALKVEVDAIVALVGTLNTTIATLQSEVAAGGDPTTIGQIVSDLTAQGAEITAALPAATPAAPTAPTETSTTPTS